ncbi:hypothetical protein ACU8NH_24230 [Rhizobium leguminosarum]
MSYNYEGFNERARKRREMIADAKCIADLQVQYDRVGFEYMQRLSRHPDFADDFKKIIERQIKFDADFEAGEKDADILLEIESVNTALREHIVADGSLLHLLAQQTELTDKMQDALKRVAIFQIRSLRFRSLFFVVAKPLHTFARLRLGR